MRIFDEDEKGAFRYAHDTERLQTLKTELRALTPGGPEFQDPLRCIEFLSGDTAAFPKILAALKSAHEFVVGFHGDELQEEIPELLAEMESAIAAASAEAVQAGAESTGQPLTVGDVHCRFLYERACEAKRLAEQARAMVNAGLPDMPAEHVATYIEAEASVRASQYRLAGGTLPIEVSS